MRPIDADALVKDIKDYPYGFRGIILCDITKQPTIDVPDRKVGKWETEVRTIRGHKIAFFACSACGRNADGEYPYCPNCGAKMERSEDGQA